MREELRLKIKEAIRALETKEKKLSSSAVEVEIKYPQAGEFGDYATNVAMKLAGKLGISPIEIARKIADNISDKRLESVEAVAPGFVNFRLSCQYLQQKVAEINGQGEHYGNADLGKGRRIHFDFVSANPTGPVTLGNARGGPLGDTLAHVLAKTGYEVWREYYVNDYGNQVKILGHSIRGNAEGQYKGDYINKLRTRMDAEDPMEAGQEAVEIILEEIIKPSMDKLGIKFDGYFSERSLHDEGKVTEAIERLQKLNFIYKRDGALWFRATKFGDDKDRVVQKSTGEITYFGGDIAYHLDKFKRGFHKAIDIWGADHHGDVPRLRGAMEALGHEGKVEILLTQFVRVVQGGKELKMSKRSGTYISVDDLLGEVGKDAVRFFFLLHAPETHMDFDVDLAKEQSEKNPVYYVQYAHARICSILRKAEEQGITSEKADLSVLTDAKEMELLREINRFPEIIEDIAASYEIHRLPYFAMKLADRFHSFYDVCPVINESNKALSGARLELIKAVRMVLEETLRLMGVSAPDKM